MALTVADISTDHLAYAGMRSRTRAEIIPIRAERRVRMGDILVFEFENEQTLRYQIQEMVYTERLTDPGEVAHEVDAYSRLLPTSHTLAATMFIELDQLDTVREELVRLSGVQRSIALEVGGVTVPGVEIRGPDEDLDTPSETVSVHMIRFAFNDETRDAFRDPGVPVELVVDHRAYSDAAPVTGATRRSLITDLALGG